MKHQACLEGYTLQSLSVVIGDLRYDSLAEFLHYLSEKLAKDALADEGRNRQKLAHELHEAAENTRRAAESIAEAWKISEPFMH